MNPGPIGIFDSGIGGLSVFTEVYKQMPNESIVYLADSFNCPYGSKSADEIIELSIKNTEFLLKYQCKLIVVACNTATAAAIDTLRSKFEVPFVGMEPAIKPAALNTNTGKIGILATKGTFEGRLFKETSQKFTQDIDTIIQVGTGLVELVEQGKQDTEEAKELLQKYITPMLSSGVDQIVLGCTHYPFFTPIIKQLVPNSVSIIDPAPAVAYRVKTLLENFGLLSTSNQTNYKFFSSGNPEILETILETIMHNKYQVYKTG